jgi:hypothetical protein
MTPESHTAYVCRQYEFAQTEQAAIERLVELGYFVIGSCTKDGELLNLHMLLDLPGMATNILEFNWRHSPYRPRRKDAE